MATEQDIYNDIADAQSENDTQAAKIAEAMSLLNAKAAGGGGGDEWVRLDKVNLDDGLTYVEWSAPTGKNFKRVRILVYLWGSMSGTTGLKVSQSNAGIYGSNGNYGIKTPFNVGAWNYPVFDLDFSSNIWMFRCDAGGVNGNNNAVQAYYSGTYQQSIQYNGGWNGKNAPKFVRLSPTTADVTFTGNGEVYCEVVYGDDL